MISKQDRKSLLQLLQMRRVASTDFLVELEACTEQTDRRTDGRARRVEMRPLKRPHLTFMSMTRYVTK